MRNTFILFKANIDPVYGPLMIGGNGKSYMEFDVKITKQRLEKGLDGMPQIEDVANWNVGAPGSLKIKTTSMALTQFSAKTIYRIVTVQVSDH